MDEISHSGSTVVELSDINVSPEGWTPFSTDISVSLCCNSIRNIEDAYWKVKFVGDIAYFRKELQTLVEGPIPIKSGPTRHSFMLPGLDTRKLDPKALTSASLLVIKLCTKVGVKRKIEEELTSTSQFNAYTPLYEALSDEGELVHGQLALVVSIHAKEGQHYRNIFPCC